MAVNMSSTPRFRGTPTRSPMSIVPSPCTKAKLPPPRDPALILERIVGSTCASSSSFDVHAETRSFAYTAGATAVIATLDEHLKVTQQFYRTDASIVDGRQASLLGASCLSPTHTDAKARVSRTAREDSPFSSVPAIGSPIRPSSATERVKAATALALSPDGKWLAVGESGYKPRILLYARDTDNPSPLPCRTRASIAEHTHGVHFMAFSPDSTLLATLGTVHDGSLCIWTIERSGSLTLLTSNKCTNFVRRICWLGRNLVGVGVRFIKVWRPDSGLTAADTGHKSSPSPNSLPLQGRNTILGDLIEATFSAIVAVSPSSGVICTESGTVCLLDNSNGQQRLIRIKDVDFAITAAALGPSGRVVVAGEHGMMETIDVPHGLPRTDSPIIRSRPTSPTKPTQPAPIADAIVAVGCVAGSIVTLDHLRTIQLFPISADAETQSTTLPLLSLSSHSSSILGVRHAPGVEVGNEGPQYLTWTATGAVAGWSRAGQPTVQCDVPLDETEEGDISDLQTVGILQDSLIVGGDRFGVLSVVDTHSGKCLHRVRAHTAQVTEIAACRSQCHGTTYLVSAARDRTVQLFAWRDSQLELQQTFCEHVGSVTNVCLTNDATRLISCSADRTIVVRRRNETSRLFEVGRTITLKAAPASMRMSCYDDTLLVSTTDRNVHLIDCETGETRQSFKTTDHEGGEPVVLTSLLQLPTARGPYLIAGISSLDKSIRLYTEDGTLLGREWGHSEGLTDMALIRNSCVDGHRFVTVAADGTVFIWRTKRSLTSGIDPKLSQGLSVDSPGTGSPLSRPPLRKVMSMSTVGRASNDRKREDGGGGLDSSSRQETTSPTRLVKKRSRLDVKSVQGPLRARKSTAELCRQRFRTPSPGVVEAEERVEDAKPKARPHFSRGTTLPASLSRLTITDESDGGEFVDIALEDDTASESGVGRMGETDLAEVDECIIRTGSPSRDAREPAGEIQRTITSMRDIKLRMKVAQRPRMVRADSRLGEQDEESTDTRVDSSSAADPEIHDRVLMRYLEMEVQHMLEAIRVHLTTISPTSSAAG